MSKGRTLSLGGQKFELTELTAEDRDDLLEFARALPEADLQFLRMDITQESVVDRWVRSVTDGLRFTVLARRDGKLVGYGSLNRGELGWMRHMGEIRVIVGNDVRRSGLGGVLARETFEIAKDLGLSKIIAQMAREQNGARKLFENLGFTPEALLTDWVIDRGGETRDLIIMSYDPTGFDLGA